MCASLGTEYRDRLNGRYEATDLGQVLPASAQIEADFRGNGHLDRVLVTRAGSIQYAADNSKPISWLTISLEGVKSLKTPTGAEIEIKFSTR